MARRMDPGERRDDALHYRLGSPLALLPSISGYFPNIRLLYAGMSAHDCPPKQKNSWEDTMTNQINAPYESAGTASCGFNRRRLIRGAAAGATRGKCIRGAAALAATAVPMKAASAATVTPLWQTGAPKVPTDPLLM